MAGAGAFQLSIEASRRGAAGDDEPEHGIGFRFVRRWQAREKGRLLTATGPRPAGGGPVSLQGCRLRLGADGQPGGRYGKSGFATISTSAGQPS